MSQSRFDAIVAERVGRRRLMEPDLLTPSDRPSEHRRIGAAELVREAEVGTQSETIRGDRVVKLHLDASVGGRLSATDLATIRASVAANGNGDGNTRSRWHRLENPFTVPVAGRLVTFRVLQIKGVVFDARAPLHEYLGTGWRPEYYFADGAGLLRRYFPCDRDSTGTCDLTEAAREFVFVRSATSVLDPARCGVPVGVGWGSFPEFAQGKFGFSVLGLPTLSERAGNFFPVYDRFVQQGDFAPLAAILHQRARSLGYANRRGFAMPFRHFHNTSLAEDGTLFMHDLGDQGAILLRHALSVEQFVAEVFTNFAFAVAPLEHIVDGAPRFQEVRDTVTRHLDLFARPMIDGYFDDDPAVAGFDYDAVQWAFRAGFGCSMRENPEEFAQVFRRSLLQALSAELAENGAAAEQA
jgi:hypothetical protein